MKIDTQICEKRPTYMSRPAKMSSSRGSAPQVRQTFWKKYRYMQRDTWICEKRHTYMKRDLYEWKRVEMCCAGTTNMWQEKHIYEKRPIQETYIWKEMRKIGGSPNQGGAAQVPQMREKTHANTWKQTYKHETNMTRPEKHGRRSRECCVGATNRWKATYICEKRPIKETYK